MAVSLIEKRALSDLVYEKIRAMIDEGALPTGRKINKLELSERLGVSQTPINDALSRLAGEWLIEQRSRQGFYVRSYSYAELVPLYELRAALEGMAIRLCVESRPPEDMARLVHAFDGFELPVAEARRDEYMRTDKVFHESIIQFSGNPFLIDLARTSAFLTKSNLRGLVRPPEETLPEHRAIIAAVKRRDAVAAQEEVILHMLRSRDRLRTLEG
jgi:DNA-binding GntR family transcriptional regulator